MPAFTWSQVFFWILVERFLTTGGTEVIRLAFVVRFASSCGRINIHMANGIMYSRCHKLVSFEEIIRHLEALDKGQIAYRLPGLHSHGHGEHEQIYVHDGKNNDQSSIRHEGTPGCAGRLVILCDVVGCIQ